MYCRSGRTGYRLWLDTHYDVQPSPFNTSVENVLENLPAELPGAVDDFDIFLPDDHVNGAHGPIARQHPSVRTEMAAYRDGEALLVLQRLWDGPPLERRCAPANEDGANILVMADARRSEGLYLGVNPEGGYLATVQTGLMRDVSEDELTSRPASGDARVMARKCEGFWAAAYRVPFGAIPGWQPGAGTLAFTAGRLWGETFEPIAWASPLVWAPVLSLMGTLHLTPRAGADEPHLHRADILYDPDTEDGELVLSVRGAAGRGPAPVVVTINTEQTRHACACGEVRMPWVPEDGDNAVGIKVGAGRTIRFQFEKWSGHRLLPRAAGQCTPPSMHELAALFRRWHDEQEKTYVAPGTWKAYETPTGRYGFDHHCAFPMEPYAWACLCLDRDEVYVARVRESCDRIAAALDRDGCILCYHFSDAPQPFDGGAFGHGSASEALCLGYRVLGDERCLAAARRAADAYDMYRLEYNTNYMAFVIWHLSELYELTGEERCVDRAVWYTENAILRGFTPCGNFPGHNYYTAYGNITLKGLAKLYRVLPGAHPLRDRLGEIILRYTNQMLSRQRANGLFDGRNRMYFGYMHTVPGLFEVARAFGGDVARALEPVLYAMFDGQTNRQRRAGGPHPPGLDVALMARHLSEKEGSPN
jgi:hypothetical protein